MASCPQWPRPDSVETVEPGGACSPEVALLVVVTPVGFQAELTSCGTPTFPSAKETLSAVGDRPSVPQGSYAHLC